MKGLNRRENSCKSFQSPKQLIDRTVRTAGRATAAVRARLSSPGCAGERGGDSVFRQSAAVSVAARIPAGDLVSDDGLIERSRRGDLSAFNQLVRRHYTSIYEVALRLSPCPDDAADIAQEVFIAAWKQLPRFQPRASFRTWLHAIALRQCALSARAARPLPASLDRLAGPAFECPERDSVPTLVERRGCETPLHAAIQSLPRAQ